MTGFHLMRPEFLWALVPAVLLGLTLWRQGKRGGGWSSVIDPHLLPYLVGPQAGARSLNLMPLLLIGWIIAAVAASGPSFRKIPQPIHQKQDALVLVLDLSYSMKAADLAPSRIDRARQKLLDLLQGRKEGQTGLVAFAGDAHIVTPLTDDTPTIANLLPALHPDMMPVPGSDPVTAVKLAVDLLHSAGIRQGKILLVTDSVADKDHSDIAKTINNSGMQFGIMGIGTETGAPLPMPRGGFLKDESGAIVMPGLDESELRSVASEAGGRYRRMQIDNSDLDYLLAELPTLSEEQTLALNRTADTWEDQGYFLILLLLPLTLGLFRRGWILTLLPLLFLTQPQPAHAGVWDDLWLTRDQQGQRALQKEDNQQAAQLFANPDWAGTAAYRDGDYEGAVEHFKSTENADSWYNRGNALAHSGDLDAAIEAYKESLEQEPERTDAQENLALLEKLKEQQEQQEQQQGEDGDSQNQDQQNQDQQNQDQQDQQQSSDQSQQDQQQQESQDQSPQQQQGDPSQQDENEQQDQQQPSEPKDEPGEEEQQESQEPSQQQEGEPGEEQAAMASAEEQTDQEHDQAMEQWLRRVPDDPSGLLREKFRYESRQRQQQGKGKNDKTYW